MSPSKPVLIAVGVSLGLHAAAGWSIVHPLIRPFSRNEPIDISYAITAAAPKPVAVEPKLPAAKKKIPPIPIPRYTTAKDRKAAAAKPKLPLFNAAAAPRPAVSAEAKPSGAAPAQPKSSAEMMADPVKGRIFVGYFADVKKKIQQTLVERYAHRYSGKGSVELMFVLTAEGFVEKVHVMPHGTEAEDVLQDMAVQCLRLSAPFGTFPSELGSRPIAFNVTIYFDGI